MGGKSCSAAAKLHYVKTAVHLWLKMCNHNHELNSQLAEHGLDPDTKAIIIIELLEAGITKPNLIINIFTERQLPVPSKVKLTNFLNYYRKTNNPNIIYLHQLSDFCEAHLKFPDDLDAFFVVSYETDADKKEFKLFYSTKTLLSLANLDTHIHTDATYKLNFLGYPVLLFGLTDKNRKFHPVGMMICVTETREDYAFGFAALKKGVEQVNPTATYKPNVLIADAAAAITNGFSTIFGEDFLRVHCWAHTKRAYDKKLLHIKDTDIRTTLEQQLSQLQLCDSQELFLSASNLWLKTWKTTSDPQVLDFVNYFEDNWISINSGWYEGLAIGYPSTNNALEATNRVIKDDFTLRDRLPTGECLSRMKKMLENWSARHNPEDENAVLFSTTVKLTFKLHTSASTWLDKEPQLISEVFEDETVYYCAAKGKPDVTDPKVKKYCREAKNRQWRKFDSFVDFQSNIRKITFRNNDWTSSQCTCPYFLKNYMCKHIIGLAIRNNCYALPANVNPIKLGEKRKRGRPKGATKALIYQ